MSQTPGQNEPFSACFVVKNGAVKTVHVNERGDEKILGFYLPGDMFGLEGIVNGVQACSAVALSRSILCRLNFRKLEAIGRQLPALQHWLLQSMSRELNSVERMTRWLSYSTAEERVIGFLLDVSFRLKRRHMVHHQFRLDMARTDIANFLGLAVETVSRVLTRLDRDDVVRIQGRQVELLNLPELHRRAGFEDNLSAPAPQLISVRALAGPYAWRSAENERPEPSLSAHFPPKNPGAQRMAEPPHWLP